MIGQKNTFCEYTKNWQYNYRIPHYKTLLFTRWCILCQLTAHQGWMTHMHACVCESGNGWLPVPCHANISTHWGRVTNICVGNLTITGSYNGLSPGWRQAIIWTNAGIWSMGPLGTNFNGILIEIHTFSFKKIHLKMSSAKWRLFCLGLNELINTDLTSIGHLATNFGKIWVKYEGFRFDKRKCRWKYWKGK